MGSKNILRYRVGLPEDRVAIGLETPNPGTGKRDEAEVIAARLQKSFERIMAEDGDGGDGGVEAPGIPRATNVLIGTEPYSLVVFYDGGEHLTTGLGGLIFNLPYLAPLKDLDEFATAGLGDSGYVVRWACGLDIPADALHYVALAQQDMTGQEVVNWQKRVGLSNSEAAEALGCAPRTFKAYKTMDGPVPAIVTITCRAFERDPMLKLARVKPKITGRPKVNK